MSDFLLEATQVRKAFGGVVAVAGVDLSVRAGEIFALIGPNGAGKTTLFNVISGAHRLDAGQVVFDGHPIHHLAPHKIAARGLVRTFQNLQIFNNMSALENVMLGRHLRSRDGFLATSLRWPGTAAEEQRIRAAAHDYLALVGLKTRADLPASSLPFGQQRLVEIARALASEPKMLLLDEPAAGLNAVETGALDQLICRIRHQGVTVLLVEHDMNLVMGIADRIAVLHYGQKICEGAPSEVQADEAVIRAYLGVDWDIEGLRPPAASRSALPKVQ
ncbi:MAG: ABC transporter ATP-binding protein [Chloroflexi bacterium]|nr:ABC transporter ATP-binding protein [Chloroflexota bacterium]